MLHTLMRSTARHFIEWCMALTIGILVGACLNVAGSESMTFRAAVTEHPLPHRACPNDDGDVLRRCVWDADHMGNGLGDSFYVVRGEIHYVTHTRAHRLVDWRRINHPWRGHDGCRVSRGWIRWVWCTDGYMTRWW